MPFFICPNCKERSVDLDGYDGFSTQAVQCRSCAFGFLYELLEDYYPAPETGFVVCDRHSRVLAAGRGVFELTGYREPELLGRDLVEMLGLRGSDGVENPLAVALEWGVRRLGERLALRTRGGIDKTVTADVFPAYDEDGGLLVALLLRFSTLTEGATGEQMGLAVEHKLAYISDGATGWGDLFVRAVLCNFMINLAMLLVYNGIIKDDLTRSLAMIMSVFIFAFLGLEHSVANTVLFAIVGLRDGIDVGLAAANLGIALLGNFLGGGLLIGLYYAYVNDDAAYLRRHAAGRGPTI